MTRSGRWLQRRHLDVDIEEPLAPARRARTPFCGRRPSARVVGAIYPRLRFSVMENDSEEGAVDLEYPVVLDESELAELVHEVVDAGARGANHLRQRLL